MPVGKELKTTVVRKLQMVEFVIKRIVLEDYCELEVHIFVRKTSDEYSKRLQTLFRTLENKFEPSTTTTGKVIVPSHGNNSNIISVVLMIRTHGLISTMLRAISNSDSCLGVNCPQRCVLPISPILRNK